jgi:hypothetical protein
MSNKKAQLIEFPTPITPSEGEAVVLDDEPQEEEVIFTIGLVPGAPDEVILGEPDDDDEEEVQEVTLEPEEIDEWNWEKSHGVKKFLHWLRDMIDGTPSHSGKDTTGIERALSYFKRLDTEVSKAMSKDFKREIDSAKAQEARDMIRDGLDKLSGRLEKLLKKTKKRASETNDLIKEAETTTTGNIQIVVPYMISFVARTCIDASVQGGKDMKDTFEKLGKEYNLDKREKVQVIQLIKDMNYPLTIDRIRILDGVLDINDGEGEWIKGYQA